MAEGETEKKEALITAGLLRGEDVIVDICLEFGTRQNLGSGGGVGAVLSFTI